MAVPIKKGVEFDCLMFEVHCKQPCVSGGIRHIDKCPYDNYNGTRNENAMANPNIPKGYQGVYAKNSNGGDTLVIVTTETGTKTKGAKTMAKNNNTPANSGGNTNFQPTFRKYADMSQGEKDAFRQGAKTSENKVKERLGFIRPSDAKKN